MDTDWRAPTSSEKELIVNWQHRRLRSIIVLSISVFFFFLVGLIFVFFIPLINKSISSSFIDRLPAIIVYFFFFVLVSFFFILNCIRKIRLMNIFIRGDFEIIESVVVSCYKRLYGKHPDFYLEAFTTYEKPTRIHVLRDIYNLSPTGTRGLVYRYIDTSYEKNTSGKTGMKKVSNGNARKTYDFYPLIENKILTE